MTEEQIMRDMQSILNREFPKDRVPTVVCDVEFIKGVYNFIDRLQSEVCYLEDRIDVINTEKAEIINRLEEEIAVLKANLE